MGNCPSQTCAMQDVNFSLGFPKGFRSFSASLLQYGIPLLTPTSQQIPRRGNHCWNAHLFPRMPVCQVLLSHAPFALTGRFPPAHLLLSPSGESMPLPSVPLPGGGVHRSSASAPQQLHGYFNVRRHSTCQSMVWFQLLVTFSCWGS